jgi:uncharacterized tellurite resistance protein B-like protein
MDLELRTKVCRLIAGLVVSDDDLDEREDAFLDRLLARFGIPAEDRDTIFPIVDRSEAAAEIKTLPGDVQLEAFGLLLEATAADGKVAPEERAYLDAVAVAIGVGQEELQSRLDAALAAAK